MSNHKISKVIQHSSFKNHNYTHNKFTGTNRTLDHKKTWVSSKAKSAAQSPKPKPQSPAQSPELKAQSPEPRAQSPKSKAHRLNPEPSPAQNPAHSPAQSPDQSPAQCPAQNPVQSPVQSQYVQTIWNHHMVPGEIWLLFPQKSSRLTYSKLTSTWNCGKTICSRK